MFLFKCTCWHQNLLQRLKSTLVPSVNGVWSQYQEKKWEYDLIVRLTGKEREKWSIGTERKEHLYEVRLLGIHEEKSKEWNGKVITGVNLL